MPTNDCFPRKSCDFKRTANVPKLPVFEEQKMLPPRDFIEPFNGLIREVVNDVSVGFQDTDVVTDFFGEAEQGGRSMNVGRNAEIGLLNGNQLK